MKEDTDSMLGTSHSDKRPTEETAASFGSKMADDEIEIVTIDTVDDGLRRTGSCGKF